MRIGLSRLLAAAVILIGISTGSAQTNGIFADFTTSMGSFTCQLSYSNSPIAVANFIGLATGQRAWMDISTGEIRTNAFYDGLTFHRVISGFVIQSGSLNGQGTDGPGYAFVDQFSPALNFNNPWMLAMANSGKNSNGSQFFVTVAPYAYGNTNYVILGRVVSGTNVVAAINHVKTDSNDKPLTNVVIQHLSIRREGAAAQAFDINTQGLPVVTNIPIALAQVGQKMSLSFSNRLYSDNRWYWTTNFHQWMGTDLGIEVSEPFTNSIQFDMDTPAKFLRLAQTQYPSSTFAPKSLRGRTLVLAFSQGRGTHTIVFNNTGGGTYSISPTASGTLTYYAWSQNAYSGTLPIEYATLTMSLELDFTSAKAGTFSGTVYSLPSFSVSGTFTLSQ